MLVYPDNAQVLTPRAVRDTLVYSAREEVPDEISCPAQEASSDKKLTLNDPR